MNLGCVCVFKNNTFAVVGLTRCPRDFLPKCSRGILFVCFLGVVPFVTRREIFHRCLFRAGPAFVLVCEDHFCHDFLPGCSRGILFVCFLGVVPFVTRREIFHRCLFRAGPAFVPVREDHFRHDFLSKCSRGILFVCFLGVLPLSQG